MAAHRFMHAMDVFGDSEPVIRYDARPRGLSSLSL
jgi:hypothetical protein